MVKERVSGAILAATAVKRCRETYFMFLRDEIIMEGESVRLTGNR